MQQIPLISYSHARFSSAGRQIVVSSEMETGWWNPRGSEGGLKAARRFCLLVGEDADFFVWRSGSSQTYQHDVYKDFESAFVYPAHIHAHNSRPNSRRREASLVVNSEANLWITRSLLASRPACLVVVDDAEVLSLFMCVEGWEKERLISVYSAHRLALCWIVHRINTPFVNSRHHRSTARERTSSETWTLQLPAWQQTKNARRQTCCVKKSAVENRSTWRFRNTTSTQPLPRELLGFFRFRSLFFVRIGIVFWHDYYKAIGNRGVCFDCVMACTHSQLICAFVEVVLSSQIGAACNSWLQALLIWN